jgi:CHAD domain-containing protein
MSAAADNFLDRSTPLLKERIRTVFRHLPKALAGEEEPLHQMRVASRRLRVALPLLARRPRGRRVRQALMILRAMTRAGGGSRDLDVSLALLEKRLGELETVGPELVTLRRRLRAARSRSRGKMANDLFDIPIARLRRRLFGVVRRGGDDVFTIMSRLRDATEAGRTELLATLDTLGDRFEPVDLHRLRIRIRRFRYTAEVLDALRSQPCGAPALFKQVQERLGQIHDVHVLATWLTRQVGLAEKRGETALADEARRQVEWFVQKSREQHKAFLDAQPREILRRAFEAMGPARSAA